MGGAGGGGGGGCVYGTYPVSGDIYLVHCFRDDFSVKVIHRSRKDWEEGKHTKLREQPSWMRCVYGFIGK